MKSLYTKLQKAVLCLGLGALAQGCGMELSKTEPNEITLTRSYQRVQRYTCAGALRSDMIESVQSPEKWVSLTPNPSSGATGVAVTNRENGDSTTWSIGSENSYKFLVKYHTREGGLKVERGRNFVDYSFSKCQHDAGTSNCSSNPVVESGTLTLDITYVEETREGTSVVHEPCPAPSVAPSN